MILYMGENSLFRRIYSQKIHLIVFLVNFCISILHTFLEINKIFQRNSHSTVVVMFAYTLLPVVSIVWHTIDGIYFLWNSWFTIRPISNLTLDVFRLQLLLHKLTILEKNVFIYRKHRVFYVAYM